MMDCKEFSEEVDAFKDSFKFYKNKNSSPDLSSVIDFAKCDQAEIDGIIKVKVNNCYEDNELLRKLDLNSPMDWKVYSVTKLPGLLFIVNPFTAAGQRYWIDRCLYDYPNPPNITNLNNLGKNKRKLQNSSDIWKYLRWTTLGYHHNWDTKVYSLDNNTPFPSDLASLTQFFASVLGFNSYSAEAAIVNYYHLNSTLAGHVDKSEFDFAAPLFSISFGQPAIFLLGGPTKATEPCAMLVRSGDVIVMSGESRTSYHAIPRILSSELSPWIEKDECATEERKIVDDYIRASRINLNVRQVFPSS